MKPIFIRLAIMLGFMQALVSAFAEETHETVTRLTLVYADGSEKHFNLFDEPEITFDGANMVVSTPTIETTVARNQLQYYHFTKGEAVSGIEDIPTGNNSVFTFSNNVITVTGASAVNLAVYDLSGRKLIETHSVDGSATADLSNLPAGVYIAATADMSVKVVKQ